MCDTEANKHICMLDSLFDRQQTNQHIHLKEKKQVS